MKKVDQIFNKGADEELKDLMKHFRKDGWDLDYSIVLQDLFYKATGKNLEQYLLPKLSGKKLYLNYDKDKGLMLSKSPGKHVLLDFKGTRKKKR